ncbi:MAG TPA: ATP-grasp domain-containing protein [Planctomycetota bacterium]|jgi:glutathione synthase/RimK-type ligase-like ATP-grasp enzyme
MDRPDVALFGRKDDKQLLALAREVDAAGGTPIPLNLGFDEKLASPVALGSGRAVWDGVDFTNIQSVAIRASAPSTLPALPPVFNAAFQAEWRVKYIREQEYQSLAYSFFSVLGAQGKLVVNPLTAYIDHNAKAQFYERMRAQGFVFPKTLTTNEPERAIAFVREMKEVVVKPGIGIGSTRRLREDQLARMEEFALCPVTMQEYVAGRTIRVHVVGDAVVLALKILTDEIDSRTGTKGFEYYRLPEEEERKIARANRMLGLHFAAWDVLAAEDGRFVYLDCNPGPYLMWIGEQNVKAVYGQLAQYLVTFAQTRSIAEASARVQPVRK